MKAASYVGRVGVWPLPWGSGPRWSPGTGYRWRGLIRPPRSRPRRSPHPQTCRRRRRLNLARQNRPRSRRRCSPRPRARRGRRHRKPRPASSSAPAVPIRVRRPRTRKTPRKQRRRQRRPSPPEPAAESGTEAPVTKVGAVEVKVVADPQPELESPVSARVAVSSYAAQTFSAVEDVQSAAVTLPAVPSLRPWPTAFDPGTVVTYVGGLVSSLGAPC